MIDIKVEVGKVDLTTIIGEGLDGSPVTLADAVVQQVASNAASVQEHHDLLRRIRDLRDEEIREQLRPIIAQALNEPLQRTNEYGRAVGEPKPLTELVVEAAQKWLQARERYGSEQTRAQALIESEVDRALKRELSAVIADEKAKVVAAVRAKAADLIATAVKEGVGR